MTLSVYLGLPRVYLAKLAARPAADNFAWLVLDRGLRMILSLIIGTWSVRYLGKDNFGLLNFGLSLVAIFAGVTTLGMEGLVVREIIRDRDRTGVWLGTAIPIRFVASCVGAILSMGWVMALRFNSRNSWEIVGVLAIGMIGQSLETGELLFQARSEMRRLIVPRLGVCLAMYAIRVALMIGGMSVFWFAACTALEQISGGLLTLAMVHRTLGKGIRLKFEAGRGLALLRESWPLALSAISVIAYTKAGQILVGTMLGDTELGVYAAAVRVPDTANFLPMILATSLLPRLVRSYHAGELVYRRELLWYFRVNTLVAYCLCIPLCLGSSLIVHLLYSRTFAESAKVMAVYVWCFMFIFLGVARGQHLINERLTRLALFFSTFGLVVSIVFNYLLIRSIGAFGAAVAAVFGYAASGFLSSFFFPRVRPIGRLQLIALLTPWGVFEKRSVPQPAVS